MLSESRKEYEACFALQTYAPLYSASWWLDATCGVNQWDVLRLTNPEDRGNILLPVYATRIRGLRSVITPPLTQWVPVLATDKSTTVNLQNILSVIPGYPILDLTFKPGQHLLPPDLPFQNRMRYSFVVFPAMDKLTTRKGYNEGLRRNLKEAVSLYTIEESEDARLLLQLCRDSYKQRGMKEPVFLASVLPEVIRVLRQKQRGRLRMAYENGKAIAGILT
ncbi:MAG: GNAT family N-acetyltransferase, partial [Bacteroidota bacterium]|nr:GNAT family N-acetyltransferase [Bacteroidota bacterium]